MTFNTNKTAWSSRRDFRPLADPNPLSDAQAEDRLNQLDRAINGVGMHLDFATRCRRIVADAERRGVARRAPEPASEPRHSNGKPIVSSESPTQAAVIASATHADAFFAHLSKKSDGYPP